MQILFKMKLIISITFACFFILASCGDKNPNAPTKQESSLYPKYPDFPKIIENDTNRISVGKAVLGKKLFYEKQLSQDNTIACASCHQQEHAFASQGNAVNPSVGGQANFRNVPPIFNIGFYLNYFWDGRAESLERMFHEDLTQLEIFHNAPDTILKRLNNGIEYKALFHNAFGDSIITTHRVADAIAVFVRTIVSGSSKYDKFIRGDSSALDDAEKRGMQLFMSERTNCSSCHIPPLFTDMDYHSTGINTHYFDFGRYYVTVENSDRGKFRTPTVRNVEYTAPFMHNGEVESLKELIEHYNNGGKLFINKSHLIRSLYLTEDEKSDLLSFLLALSDEAFIKDLRYKKDK